MTETPNPHIIDADTLTGGLRPIRRVVIALGSNLGDRAATLQGALNALADTPGVDIVGVSPVYETAPVDAPEGSPKFLNAVVVADSTLHARTLLERALAIEDAFGRVRTTPGAPRTLDVDLLVVGDKVIHEDDFVLPHPRAHERAFVLVPWAQVDPDGVIPGRGRVGDLVRSVDTTSVTRVADLELRLE
ncbi:2-amino-4-hydroxy-6-hydroxymethyldihydropteridine diphosphokinase [Thermasporomyces composti]|uniref:2-amino-4-hydroxy-6-hydroxymethyldihydropteridine diphosphokinase n=1 Tax=Thermasporomyces composti TaxID=696763 RepID=A0A3D9VI96_THECX|nr:2-amino-4-hydroxy-6-hydroxymethyldihydropteridine diphosphokinase [Thermasporomyces composti]REF37031.1 2-amino-4-hydroxy-6-hydroxymethyldihydropteridine diphosphokinase [Thermasporomyces composti]